MSDTNDNNVQDKQQVHKIVREAYAARVNKEESGCCSQKQSSCCSKVVPSADTARAAEKMGYSAQDVETVPDEANLGLGCGAPLKAANVQPGNVVLDLGSGGGMDAFLAAPLVGPSGKVIGVDMTPEMVELAKKNAARRGSTNVDFRLGTIEELPVDSNSVDVILSNCVINLSPDKSAVFREAYRVLKPGGRVALSDITLTQELPASVKKSIEAYVGCIAGASLLEDYLDAIRTAGFIKVSATTRRAFDVLAGDDPIVAAALEGLKEDRESVDLASVQNSIVSATVVAYKE